MMCGLVKRSSLLYLISSFRKGHLQLSETENGAQSKAGGAALSGLRDWQMCGSFSGLLGPKYLPSPASIPTPPCPTHLGGFRTPNLHTLQRLSLLLGKLAFPRLPPVYRKSLRNNWRLPGCFFPPACFLCRSYSESLGLGCCWGDSQTSLSRWKSVFIHKLPRNLWVGRKKNPNTRGKKRTKQKLLSPHHLTDRVTKNITHKAHPEKQMLSRHEVKERSL